MRKAELERDGGRLVYDVEIRKADGILMEVEIDARSGNVLEIELEDDDE
jgi:uncharacterized membrane protein YkoI